MLENFGPNVFFNSTKRRGLQEFCGLHCYFASSRVPVGQQAIVHAVVDPIRGFIAVDQPDPEVEQLS